MNIKAIHHQEQKGQRFTKTYIIALFLIALFTISSQFAVQYFLSHQDAGGRVINIAGRQRMLSQKITKHALFLFQSKQQKEFQTQRELLKNALELWEKSQLALQEGNPKLELAKPELSEQTLTLFSEIQPFQEKITKAGTQILSIDFQDINKHQNLLRDITNNEAEFLKLMDDIVFQFETESESKVFQLKVIEVSLMSATLLLLLLEAIFIFKPIATSIKKYIQEIQLKNRELLETQHKLQGHIEELQVSKEELIQNQDEISAQRDTLENRNRKLDLYTREISIQRDTLETRNRKLDLYSKNLETKEMILKKSNDDLKKTQSELKEKNELLERSNKQLNLSINSAKTIQEAILPDEQIFQGLVEEHFIINQPKDIVSGDFYWIAKVENRIILVGADCTGHGVPGAFMTLIGANLLNKTIVTEKIYHPDLILEALHLEVSFALKQQITENNSGMDVCIVSLEKSEQGIKCVFAGAKNNLFIWSRNDLIELKGTRKSIGGFQNDDIRFENQEIILEEGDLIYLGSDGLEDQSNYKRKKFGRNQLRKLIREVHNLPLLEQKIKFENALNKHMSNTDQRDDILWMGIRV